MEEHLASLQNILLDPVARSWMLLGSVGLLLVILQL